jgi:hypothetical protein
LPPLGPVDAVKEKLNREKTNSAQAAKAQSKRNPCVEGRRLAT